MPSEIKVFEPTGDDISAVIEISVYVSNLPPHYNNTELRSVLARRVYNPGSIKSRLRNRLTNNQGGEIPTGFIPYDAVIRFLIHANVLGLLTGIVFSLINGNSNRVVLGMLLHQSALCSGLLSFYLLFVNRQVTTKEGERVEDKTPHPLRDPSESHLIFFVVSVLLLLLSFFSKVQSWTAG